MSVVTGLKKGKRREKRVNVFLDGLFAYSLEAETVLEAGLRVGQELTADQERQLTGNDSYRKCFNAASRLLGYRPRSERELRTRLLDRGYEKPVINRAVTRFRELGLVDDAEFARYWAENREQFSPRSRRMMTLELSRKGLDREVIEQAVGDVDETESALRAAEKKARTLPVEDYEVFRRRLGAYLGRRGFNYEIINSTVEKIWKEKSNTLT